MKAIIHKLLAAVLALWVLAACSLLEFAPGTGPAATGDVADDRFPDVLAVDLQPRGDGSYDVAVTLSSPYDTPQRYADGWRVLDAEGNVLGTHTLLHDHAAEQPFNACSVDLDLRRDREPQDAAPMGVFDQRPECRLSGAAARGEDRQLALEWNEPFEEQRSATDRREGWVEIVGAA